MMDLEDYLGAEGLLSRQIEGFAFRQQQLEMASAVARAIENAETLICEAGTGTGKTFAYLLPVLLSGKKAIVSTGTRNLQDQLFHRDLPMVRQLLASPVAVALLKGRANYLCVNRMDNALADARGHSAEHLQHLKKIRDWSAITCSGDIAELGEVAESASVWALVTSTAENCLGQDCPSYRDCHLVEARRKAQEADVVIINHHLLCADFALKDDGFGELLPDTDCFIIDEAHQLPDVAGNFFGSSLSGRQLLELTGDIETEYRKAFNDLPRLLTETRKVSKQVRDLRLLFGVEPRKGSWQEISEDKRYQQALTRLDESLQSLLEVLALLRGRSRDMDNCLERAENLKNLLQQISSGSQSEESGEHQHSGEPETQIRWFETFRQSFRFNLTPLDISRVFAAQMQRHPASWVFTSATLSVAGHFDHFQHQLGIQKATTGQWESPFDYASQALWYVPRGLPQPAASDYNREVAELSVKIVKYSQGRAFLLYTSYRAMHEALAVFEKQLEDFPLLVQGRQAKHELLDRFRRLGNAVLLGTASFWEGVDVRGEALSCVIIDKLPFASPGDPVLQARIDAMRRRGSNPFMEYQVPQAAIQLKQGAGRLIRDSRDRGVLVTCDPRLLSRSKPYGRIFLDSMPGFARTRDLQDVERFFST